MKHIKVLMIVASFFILYLGYKFGKSIFKTLMKRKHEKM